jgi:hypothetical protein
MLRGNVFLDDGGGILFLIEKGLGGGNFGIGLVKAKIVAAALLSAEGVDVGQETRNPARRKSAVN